MLNPNLFYTAGNNMQHYIDMKLLCKLNVKYVAINTALSSSLTNARMTLSNVSPRLLIVLSL